MNSAAACLRFASRRYANINPGAAEFFIRIICGIYRIAAEEGMGIDCVSGGELYTAKHAGFPTERIYFHGNNKTLRDLIDALEMGVGTVVVDNEQELKMLGRKEGVSQSAPQTTPTPQPTQPQRAIDPLPFDYEMPF